jgi:dihydropteroate synthase
MVYLCCASFQLALDRPLVMGIVNVTPDSFSDGGLYFTPETAIEHGLRLVEEGADILDIGGESTRPGATPVNPANELRRIIPVVEALAAGKVPLSIDTRHPEVMAAAIQSGAAMINDVNALRAAGALETCAASAVGVCLMHMQGEPQTMQADPKYGDVVTEVRGFLLERVAAAEQAGIARNRLVIDPGFGFGKTFQHNVVLLRRLSELSATGIPVLAGLSRKSVLGAIVGKQLPERVVASVAAALLAAQKGAKILRVHDVKATRSALAVLQAVEGGNG